MSRSPLVRVTKWILDIMFYGGIAVCITVPVIFKQAGKFYKVFREFYLPFCIIFMVAGVFALIILWELRSIFRTVLREDPFVRENVSSLKRMGISAFCIAVIMLTRLFFVITPAALVLVAVFTIAGLFSLVLSQVFDQAVTYKLENDLTI
ncbi:hypothetical protein HNQ56_001004 [Anaerotaenia torta]|uniref:DUF2975 domain-containing protein n=1 Tax=Anaerotaenia torta TaxID=433293 RepID=UPI003D248F23